MQIADNAANPVPAPQTPLTTAARSALRARAHALAPVVMISGRGLTDGVLTEINRSLTSHELIKIRVLDTDRIEREALLAEVCDRAGALPVQHIGKILVVYRQNPERVEKEIEATPARGKAVAKRANVRRRVVRNN